MPGVTGHNLNTDLFNSHNTLRGVPTFPGSGLTTTNQLMSQANLINSQVKHGSGIGPIGTKAGAGVPGPTRPTCPCPTPTPTYLSSMTTPATLSTTCPAPRRPAAATRPARRPSTRASR